MRGAPAQVMGIWLKREGDYAVVCGEDIYGNSVELIREHIDGAFSHNISEHGINDRFGRAYWEKSDKIAAEARAKRLSEQRS